MVGEAPEVTKESIQFSDIDELARALFHKQDSTGIWAAADYIIQAHFRRQAQQKLTADTQRSLPIISGDG